MTVNKAMSLIRSGEFELAKKNYTEMIIKNPNSSYALNGMGMIYLVKGNYREAEKYFRKVLSIDKGNGDAVTYLTKVFMKTDRLEDGLEFLHSLMDNEGNYPYKDLKISRTYVLETEDEFIW